MSTTTMTRFDGTDASSSTSLASTPGIFSAMKRFYRIRAARRALGSMPDYLLNDIGISRSQIDAVTRDGRA